MSFVQNIKSEDRFVIPEVELVKIKITPLVWGLAYKITKGYIETTNFDYMLNYIVRIKKMGGISFSGKTDKIKLKDGRIVFRQRVTFKDLSNTLLSMRKFGLTLELRDAFNIPVDFIMRYYTELRPLYYKTGGMTLDEYLKKGCVMLFNLMLYDQDYISEKTLKKEVKKGNKILKKNLYLIERETKKNGGYVIYIPDRKLSKSLYGIEESRKNLVYYGYNSKTKKHLAKK